MQCITSELHKQGFTQGEWVGSRPPNFWPNSLYKEHRLTQNTNYLQKAQSKMATQALKTTVFETFRLALNTSLVVFRHQHFNNLFQTRVTDLWWSLDHHKHEIWKGTVTELVCEACLFGGRRRRHATDFTREVRIFHKLQTRLPTKCSPPPLPLKKKTTF